MKNRLTDMFTINISLPSWLGGSDSAEKASRARRALGGVTVTEQYASGTRTSGPTMALIGEGNAPEYVIPTENKYRDRAMALWQAAGKDLGVPMMRTGGAVMADRWTYERPDREEIEATLGEPVDLGFSSGWDAMCSAFSWVGEKISGCWSWLGDASSKLIDELKNLNRGQMIKDFRQIAADVAVWGTILTSFVGGVAPASAAIGALVIAGVSHTGDAYGRIAELSSPLSQKNEGLSSRAAITNHVSFSITIQAEREKFDSPEVKARIYSFVQEAIAQIEEGERRLYFSKNNDTIYI